MTAPVIGMAASGRASNQGPKSEKLSDFGSLQHTRVDVTALRGQTYSGSDAVEEST